jgi:phosphoribosylformylglycinamidine synthase
VHGESISIPGTILISAIAVMDDTAKAVSMYAKEASDLIYIVGETQDELGGSHYFDLFKALGNNVPKVNAARAKRIFEALSLACEKGLVRAMHDCSEGGLGVAAAEMAFSGGLGMDIFLSEVPYAKGKVRNDFILFSESNSRFIVEVAKKDQKDFEKILKGLPFGLLGCLNNSKSLKAYGLNDDLVLKADIKDLKEAWQKPLRW